MNRMAATVLLLVVGCTHADRVSLEHEQRRAKRSTPMLSLDSVAWSDDEANGGSSDAYPYTLEFGDAGDRESFGRVSQFSYTSDNNTISVKGGDLFVDGVFLHTLTRGDIILLDKKGTVSVNGSRLFPVQDVEADYNTPGDPGM